MVAQLMGADTVRVWHDQVQVKPARIGGPTVWHLFRSWLRTMHRDRPPSELVVAHALRASLPEFLAAGPPDPALAKFLRRRLFARPDCTRQPRAA